MMAGPGGDDHDIGFGDGKTRIRHARDLAGSADPYGSPGTGWARARASKRQAG
jgi:hypothetical protein